MPAAPTTRAPLALEASYRAHLTRRVKALHALVMARLGPLLAGDPTRAQCLRAVDGARSAAAKQGANVAWLAKYSRAVARNVGGQVDKSLAKIRRQPSDPKWATAARPDWVAESADWTRDLDAKYLDQVAATIDRWFDAGHGRQDDAGFGRFSMQGTGNSPLEQAIRERARVAAARAAFIARQQTAQIATAVTRAGHEAAGVTSFRWSTMRDERVRPAHRDLEGRVFAWDSPPSEGLPGTAINCRCTALPAPDGPEAMYADSRTDALAVRRDDGGHVLAVSALAAYDLAEATGGVVLWRGHEFTAQEWATAV